MVGVTGGPNCTRKVKAGHHVSDQLGIYVTGAVTVHCSFSSPSVSLAEKEDKCISYALCDTGTQHGKEACRDRKTNRPLYVSL